MPKKVTTESFINRANEIHKDKYDYSKVEYKSAKDTVCIICNIHGEFYQSPSNHLSGFGCNKCAIDSRSFNKIKSTDTFIEEANNKHNNFYDYSLVEYKNSKEKVLIICPEHGEFLQTPSSHLGGRGCPKCKNKQQTLEEIITRCTEIHGKDYDYSGIIFTKMKDQVNIKCTKCNNTFIQSMDKHINSGQGCPICKESHGEKIIRNWLKENNFEFTTQYEIELHKLCKNSNLVKIDFVTIHNDTKYFIEFHGKQHYEYDKFYHKNSVENFEKQKRRDKVLEEYCEMNNIKLLQIKYDIDKFNISNILNKILNDNG